KVKGSFSLRAPCVTSSRVDDDDDGAPVAWQRLVRLRERGREPEKASSLRVPFFFGVASFKSSGERLRLKSAGIVCEHP
ncbi:hypothetical protein X777_02457, partial [Ooceraea biroi]